MKITKHSKIIECSDRRHNFDRPNGSGFGFDCDAKGRVVLANDAQRASYAQAMRELADGTIADMGVVIHRWTYRQPAEGRCVCGRTVVLDGFTCPCDCGRDYNASGQMLAPREQWGEETGETAADLIGV